jgi:formylglycine-generating enzyme required for sulfatase activity
MNKLQKSAIIGVGALLLSTVAIQASDIIRGIEGNLTGMVSQSTSVCGVHATQILLGSHSICVDVYEASASSNCPHPNPQSPLETQSNVNKADCLPTTAPDVIPWRFVSLTQAQQLCARAGKRLPTNEEWYSVASGMTTSDSCNIKGGNAPGRTGTQECVTPSGIYDMVGNVWEWVGGQVVDGVYENRRIPESGYVALVDINGVVVETAKNGFQEYGEDYAWTNTTGVRGMIRGGFYGSGNDAGIFAQNIAVPLDFRTTGVGFRCVKDI